MIKDEDTAYDEARQRRIDSEWMKKPGDAPIKERRLLQADDESEGGEHD